MDARFTCRNGHGWGLSIEGPAAINARWVCCPVCGAPPRVSAPVAMWQKLVSWVQRNPAALGLAASALVLLTTVGMIALIQVRDLTARAHQAEADAATAIRETEAW